MTNVLKSVGLPASVLDLIPDITKTCRECRVWAQPGHDTIPAITMSIRFGQHVEGDLLFYKDRIVFHLLFRATRRHAGTEVQSEEEQELLDALFTQIGDLPKRGHVQQGLADGIQGRRFGC